MKTVSQIVEELNSEKEKRSERVLKESSRRKFESGLFSNLENNLSKNTFDVEVKNQVKLPDIFKIDGEVWVKDTSAILANLKKIIGEISDLKNKSVSQTKSLEKNLKPEKVDFSDLEKAVKDIKIPEPLKNVNADINSLPKYVSEKLDEIKKAIKSIEVSPVVNVDNKTPEVTIDLDGVKSRLETLVEEIKRIPKPEKQEFDLSKVENAVDKTTKAIKELVFPVPTTKTDHIATEATLKETLNKVAQKITTSCEYIYVAKAPIGTPQATAGWQVKRIHDDGTTMTITWADGNSDFDNVATDLTSLTYV